MSAATLRSPWVSADRARIEQIVSNLLDNALKYTPAGGRIHLTVLPAGNECVFEISDTGQGMAPDLIDRVFDLFVQGERSLAREPGGLGIGLTMGKRLVELHKGTIHASSAGRDAGATSTVLLPAIEPPATVTTSPAVALKTGRHSVRIVEDNRDARESLATLLRYAGYEVHTAVSGREGIDIAAIVKPDFALADIGLPDVDGYEFARRLRGQPAGSRIRLIALTGYGSHEDRRRAVAAGFDEHLAKPVDFSALDALLRRHAAANTGVDG